LDFYNVSFDALDTFVASWINRSVLKMMQMIYLLHLMHNNFQVRIWRWYKCYKWIICSKL